MTTPTRPEKIALSRFEIVESKAEKPNELEALLPSLLLAFENPQEVQNKTLPPVKVISTKPAEPSLSESPSISDEDEYEDLLPPNHAKDGADNSDEDSSGCITGSSDDLLDIIVDKFKNLFN